MTLSATNPMLRTIVVTLVFEAIVFVLAIPGMIWVDAVSVPLALALGIVAAVLAVAASAGIRKGWGWPLAWLVQVVAIALGLLTSMMFVVGGMFALLFVVEFVLGRRLESNVGAPR